MAKRTSRRMSKKASKKRSTKRHRNTTRRGRGSHKMKRRSLTGKLLCGPNEFFIPNFKRHVSKTKTTVVDAHCRKKNTKSPKKNKRKSKRKSKKQNKK